MFAADIRGAAYLGLPSGKAWFFERLWRNRNDSFELPFPGRQAGLVLAPSWAPLAGPVTAVHGLWAIGFKMRHLHAGMVREARGDGEWNEAMGVLHWVMEEEESNTDTSEREIAAFKRWQLRHMQANETLRVEGSP